MGGLGKCPVCQKLSTQENKPFCSKRCKDVDLARWFNGGYSVPAIEDDFTDEGEIEDQENKNI